MKKLLLLIIISFVFEANAQMLSLDSNKNDVDNVAVENITEELLATVQSPVASLFAETFENIKVSGVNVSGFVDAIAVNPVTDKTTINTTTNNTSYSIYVSTDNAVFELDSSYTTSSEPVAIDTGYLTACNIDLTQFDEVQSVDVELVTYDYQTWNDVAECDYEELQEKTWLDVLRKESWENGNYNK